MAEIDVTVKIEEFLLIPLPPDALGGYTLEARRNGDGSLELAWVGMTVNTQGQPVHHSRVFPAHTHRRALTEAAADTAAAGGGSVRSEGMPS